MLATSRWGSDVVTGIALVLALVAPVVAAASAGLSERETVPSSDRKYHRQHMWIALLATWVAAIVLGWA